MMEKETQKSKDVLVPFSRPSKEFFKNFKKTVLGIRPKKTDTYDAMVAKRNLRTMTVMAGIVFLLNLPWPFFILFTKKEAPVVCLAAIFLLLLSSLYILIFGSFVRKTCCYDRPQVRFSILGYHLCIVIATTLFSVYGSRYFLQNPLPDAVPLVPVCDTYLFLLVLVPLTHRLDSLILLCSLALGYLIPLFGSGAVGYEWQAEGILRLLVVICYLYMRYTLQKRVGSEISMRERNENLLEMAYVDALTGTLNKRAMGLYWDFLLSQEDAEKVGVLIYDIDYFKQYNDSYSHAQGDRILQQMSAVVSECIRHQRCYLFRYGGEEFVMMIVNPTEEEVLECGKRINRAVWDANIRRSDVKGHTRLTVSVGCAVEDARSGTVENFISRADQQLYFCKKNGRNCVSIRNEIHRISS